MPAVVLTNSRPTQSESEPQPPGPNSKKDQLPSKPHPKRIIAPQQIKPTNTNTNNIQAKKITRRSSKPIINWFQRKLAAAGSGKTKSQRLENKQQNIIRNGNGPPSSRTANRISSSPFPSPATRGSVRQQGQQLEVIGGVRRKTISLNGDDYIDSSRDDDNDNDNDHTDEDDGGSSGRSSFARESTWSPASALEADEDASLRPIPPSIPPSPSPSRSSSSYPRTFRSMAASTKPTTVLSIDLHGNGNGMAHIAQAPATPTGQLTRFPPHIRTSSTYTNNGGGGGGVANSGTSITFSALPPSPPSPASSRPSSLQNHASISSGSQPTPHGASHMNSIQAPLHTTHHPRNNPRPSSPPLDNASVLTLASSAFGVPRLGTHTPGYYSAPPSALGASDSLSHFGGSITYADAESSQFVLGDDERLELEERDVDASVRALRPRSSRRGSWESEASRWSARVHMGGTGTSSLVRETSLWTRNSVRTGGGFGGDNLETYDRSDKTSGHSGEASPLEGPGPVQEESHLLSPSGFSEDSEVTPKNAGQVSDSPSTEPSIDSGKMSVETVAQGSLPDTPKMEHDVLEEEHSEKSKDVWHSVPSTPTVKSEIIL